MILLIWIISLIAVSVLLGISAAIFTTGEKEKKKIGILSLVLGIIAVIFTTVVPGSLHQVETGTVVVVKELGVVKDIRRPGIYFDFWMTNTYTTFDSTIRKVDIDTASYSKDAQAMDISMTFQYQISNDDESIKRILTEYNNLESLETRLIKVTEDTVKSILSSSTAMHIIETRGTLSPEVETALALSLEKSQYPVTLKGANIVDINFSDVFEQAVEDKVIAEQQKEAAITKAEQELEVAKLTAQAKIEAARGDAEAQKIIAAAEGEAAALKIIELAKTLGYTVDETYTYLETTTTADSTLTKEIISDVKLSEGSSTIDSVTIETSLISTSYIIRYDAEHTMEDLDKIIIEYLEYLAYLESWDGELPDVISGSESLDIIVPNNN